MARRLNCWCVAMWLWLRSCGKQYAWTRRSHAFGGWVPHFGYAERHGVRTLKIIEYVPPKNRRWRRGGDWVLFFPGHYRVTYMRIVAVRRRYSLADTVADRLERGEE